MRALANALKENYSLKFLSLASCINTAAEAQELVRLSPSISSVIRCVIRCVFRCVIRCASIRVLLTACPIIAYRGRLNHDVLCLTHLPLRTPSYLGQASSLLLNKSLEELDVSGSKLDQGGIRCIIDAVKIGSKITSLKFEEEYVRQLHKARKVRHLDVDWDVVGAVVVGAVVVGAVVVVSVVVPVVVGVCARVLLA